MNNMVIPTIRIGVFGILNNSFQCLNNITRISIFFHLYVFLKNTNNITRTILPNEPFSL